MSLLLHILKIPRSKTFNNCTTEIYLALIEKAEEIHYLSETLARRIILFIIT